MSTRKLVSASAANLLIPISGLLASPFLSRELGPEGRGLYAALTLPIVVCGWFGTYGLQDALSFHVRNRRLSRRAAVKVILIAAVPLGVFGVGLLAVLGLFTFAGSPGSYRQYLSLALLAPLHILANLLIGALTGESDIRGVNLVKVVPAVSRTAVVVAACLLLDLSAYVASLLFLASVVGGLVIGLLRLRSGRGPAEAPTDTIPVRSLIRYSLACLPGVLAAISSARLDQVIGLPLIGAKELGYYAVGVSVAEIPMVIATAARTVLLGRPATDDPRAATRVARLAVLASALACSLLAAASGFAVPMVFGHAFAPAVLPAIILCAATALYTCMVIFGAVLLANNRAARSSTALVSGCVAGIALLALLAPLGATGAAVASLGGYGISVVVAAPAVRTLPGIESLRMLTVPYREDLRLLADWAGRKRIALTRRLDSARRVDMPALGAAALFVLAWLRILITQVFQLFSNGRPGFNARNDLVPATGQLIGDGISLSFLLAATVLVAHGIRHRRTSHLRWFAAVVAPLLAIQLSGLANHQVPGVVSLALPLAALAIWFQPPRPEVFRVVGVLGVVSAVASMALALARPDLGLLSGSAAGSKSILLGGLLAGPYPHSNALGLSLALSAPFILCFRHTLVRRSCLLVVLFAVLWTGSRTSELAVGVTLLTYGAYLLIKHEKARGWLLSVPLAAGVGMIVLAPALTSDPDGFTERGRIWTALLARWADRPVLGLGPEYFERTPDLSQALGGQFTHGHNLLVQLLTVGGLLTVVLFAALLSLAWRQSVRLAAQGFAVPAVFLIAFVHVSWLEASHVSTTLAGYLAWLPLVLIIRTGLATRHDKQPEIARPDSGEDVSVTIRSAADHLSPHQKRAASRM
jgi:O-antigen/teichoic acid export membrane protein/O-antigen ligase